MYFYLSYLDYFVKVVYNTQILHQMFLIILIILELNALFVIKHLITMNLLPTIHY
jgi:hypothetical protein